MSMIDITDFDKESMIKIRKAFVYDLTESVEASQYPMLVNTELAKSEVGQTQIKLAQSVAGSGHDNWLQGICIAFDMDISAKCLVEADRYNFLYIVSSNSTMHRITQFDMNECYNKYVDQRAVAVMIDLVNKYNEDPSSENYLRLLYTNPAGFTYTIRFTTNYRQLKTIYIQRKTHRLPEWREFCKWIESLPYSYLITGEKVENEQ